MKYREFIEAYFDIDDPETGQMVPFRFRPVQSRYYEMLCQEYGEDTSFRGLREIILKARKEGFTSLVLALFCADMLMNRHPVRYLEISYKDDATRQHFRRAEGYILSYFAKKTGVTDRKQLRRMVFDTYNDGHEVVLAHNGASFYVGTASTRTGERGGTVQGLLFTEAAHYPDTGIISASEIIESSRNMVAVGTGMIFMETTANGFNHFRTTWQQAERGEVDYRPRFFSWREFYTPEQFEQIKAGFTDKRLIAQEYPETPEDAFLTSGNSFFDIESLRLQLAATRDPIREGVIYA